MGKSSNLPQEIRSGLRSDRNCWNMKKRLIILLFQMFDRIQPDPWRDKKIELGLRDGFPLCYTSRLMAKQNIHLQTDAFKYPFQFLQIAPPESINKRNRGPHVNQPFRLGA